MFNSDKQREAGRTVFMSSVTWLASVLAFVAAFFATGPIHANTVGWIVAYTNNHYGQGLDDLVSFVWFVTVGLLSFCIARASIGTLIVVGGLAIATRFL